MKAFAVVTLAALAFIAGGCGGKSVAWRVNHSCESHGGVVGSWVETRKNTVGTLIHSRCKDGTQAVTGE